jgi:hypothetical protein
MPLLLPRGPEDVVSTPRVVNRQVFQGSDIIALRLRSARKPMIIDLMEIPLREIDFEPVLIEPVTIAECEVVPIIPLIVPACDLLPLDEDT